MRKNEKNNRQLCSRHGREEKTVRMLALDLDGTLLTDDKRLTERTAEALMDAADAGVIPVIVTGRPLAGLPESVRKLPCIRYVITSNGASTKDLRTGETLRSACLDTETAAAIVRIPMARGLVHSAFIDGMGYCEPEFMELQYRFFRGTPLEEYVRNSRQATEDIEALIRSHPEGVENVWCIAADQTERDEIAGIINGHWKVQTVLTALRDVEVGSMEADKGAAVTALAERFGIHRERILAIGDNDNDLSMFRAAGTTVAMGNAPAFVKEQASVITESNEQDGAAEMIEKFLTGGGRINGISGSRGQGSIL